MDGMVKEMPRTGSTSDEELFGSLYPGLRRFAAVVGGRDTDPDDLVQEAVAKTISRGPLTRLHAPGAYLRRAIVSIAIDAGRDLRRRRETIDALADRQRTSRSAADDVPDVLELLGSRDRAILYLVDVERYTLVEAAELTGLSHTAARSCASRARRRLREALEAEAGEQR